MLRRSNLSWEFSLRFREWTRWMHTAQTKNARTHRQMDHSLLYGREPTTDLWSVRQKIELSIIARRLSSSAQRFILMVWTRTTTTVKRVVFSWRCSALTFSTLLVLLSRRRSQETDMLWSDWLRLLCVHVGEWLHYFWYEKKNSAFLPFIVHQFLP